MFVVIFFLLGLCFGFAVRMPWALLAFLIPLGLFLVATDRSASASVLAFAVTAVGLMVGLVLASRAASRTDERTA
jgi:hypothetical protein